MASYVFSFRAQKDRTPSAGDEAAWGQWFQQIGSSISDFGNRVGQARTVGTGPTADVLGGYIVVNADNLEAATALAEGCPRCARAAASKSASSSPPERTHILGPAPAGAPTTSTPAGRPHAHTSRAGSPEAGRLTTTKPRKPCR